MPPVWNPEKWKDDNADPNLPMRNSRGSLIVIGCNYHTTWQSSKSMRFVLTEVKDDKAKLETRSSRKSFWTNIDDLIFIPTKWNNKKSHEFRTTKP